MEEGWRGPMGRRTRRRRLDSSGRGGEVCRMALASSQLRARQVVERTHAAEGEGGLGRRKGG